MFDDKAHIIYVEIKDDTPLGRMMWHLSCTNPDDMSYKELADSARYFMRDKEGQKVMSKIMEEIVNKEIYDEKIETAKRLKKMNKLSYDEVAIGSGLTVEEVEKLAELQLA